MNRTSPASNSSYRLSGTSWTDWRSSVIGSPGLASDSSLSGWGSMHVTG
jgi:hypothetical protein